MEFVNVAVRIRPPLNCESNKCLEVINTVPPVLSIKGRQQPYMFDRIFAEEVSQNEIFSALVDPLIDKAILGYNGTIFAYGQSGTGKTYTMGSNIKESNGKNIGIIKRVFNAMLAKASASKNISIEISVCEIYQEKVYDLLGNNNIAVNVRGINNFNLTQEKITDQNCAEKLLYKSCKRRHTGETKQNMYSSRSHAVFTAHIYVHNENGTRWSKLNLVDLAGCESVKKSDTKDNQLNEAIKINMSLLSVRSVINALSLGKTCIPYRESMLTRILHDSLNRRSYVTLIACISTDAADVNETIQTLEFAIKTKRVKSKPEMNSVFDDHYGTGYEFKTPRKRRYPYIQASTTAKRTEVIRSTPATLPANLQENSFLYSTVVSPIAKTIINKLENRYGYNLPLSAKEPQFYDVMRTLIKQEVQQHTTNTVAVNDVVNQISPIISRSRSELDLSGIIPLVQDFTKDKEDAILNEKLGNRSTPIRIFEKRNLNDRSILLPVINQENTKIADRSTDNLESSTRQTNEDVRDGKNNDDTLTKEISEKSISIIDRSNKKNEEHKQQNNVNINASSKELKSSDILSKSITHGNWSQTVIEKNSSNSKSQVQSDAEAEINEIESFPKCRRSARLSLKIKYNEEFQENKGNCYLKNITKDFALPEKVSHTSIFKAPSIMIDSRNMGVKTGVFQPRRSVRLSLKKDRIHSSTNSDNQTRKSEFIYYDISHINRNRSLQIAQEQAKDFRLNEQHLSRTSQRNNGTLNKNRGKTEKINVKLNQYCENSSLNSGSERTATNSLSKSKLKFSLKQADKYTDFQLNDSSILETRDSSKDIIDTSQEDEFNQSNFKTFPVFARRRSVRLSMKTSRLITSSPNESSLVLQKPNRFKPSTHGKQMKDIEMHKNRILRTLNRGNLKELQKLHTVGAKTAEQMLLFRKLNGSFRDIEDLKQILYRGKSYDRFLTSNCLNIQINVM